MIHVVTPFGVFSTPRADVAERLAETFGTLADAVAARSGSGTDPDTATATRAHATRANAQII